MAERIAVVPDGKAPGADQDGHWIWAGMAGVSAWVGFDDPARREEIATCFAGYENGLNGVVDSGVFVSFKKDSGPSLSLVHNGLVCDPIRMFTGPEWKRFFPIDHPTRRLYGDGLFGESEPSLELCGAELVVLRRSAWPLYVALAHGWLLLQSRRIAVFHAAVAAAHGTAAVLVGPSGGGKSTLSFALMEQCADSFGDEYAVFRLPDMALFAWPRPLHMRPGGLDVLGAGCLMGEWQEIRPGDPKYIVEVAAHKADCPSSRAVFYFLDGFAERPALAHIGGADASRRLLRGMIYADPDPFERLKIAADMVTRYPCWNLVLGKPGDTAALLLDHLGGLR